MKDFIKKILREKIINELNDNQPMDIIAYHGTRRLFDMFEPMKPVGILSSLKGVYFTRDLNSAIEYAEDVDGALDERSRVIKVKLKINSDKDGVISNHSYTGEEIIMFNMDKIEILDDNILEL